MDCKDRLENYLRENGVPFEVQHHPRVITAQEVAATEHVPGEMLVKVVMFLADNNMIMLALPAPYQADLEKVGEVLGQRRCVSLTRRSLRALSPTVRLVPCPPLAICTTYPSTRRRP